MVRTDLQGKRVSLGGKAGEVTAAYLFLTGLAGRLDHMAKIGRPEFTESGYRKGRRVRLSGKERQNKGKVYGGCGRIPLRALQLLTLEQCSCSPSSFCRGTTLHPPPLHLSGAKLVLTTLRRVRCFPLLAH
jgi:hypothetical protein